MTHLRHEVGGPARHDGVPVRAAVATGSGPSNDGLLVPDTRIRVLVVDDDEHMRAALHEVLDAQPDLCWVAAVGDAASALAACEEHRPHVAVVDVRIPGGGVAATRRITARHADIGIVGLSAFSDRRHRELMLAAGAASYVAKGAPGGQLLAAIREVAARVR